MDASALRRWVERLCADDLDGRAAGSVLARGAVREALAAAGLRVTEQPVPGCGGANVMAWAGEGPPYVVVGAHFDHLGGAYRGADDNAAAVAVLIELAAKMANAAPARGTMVLAAFDAEEPPYFMTEGMGSVAFVKDAPVPLREVRMAVIMDLVGHAVGGGEGAARVRDSLFVLGAEKTGGAEELVSEACGMTSPPDHAGGPVIRRVGLDFIPPLSDYAAFRAVGVPPLFLTCGRWKHYHTPDDTPDRLDYAKLAGIGDFVERLARGALDWSKRPTYDDDAADAAGTAATLRELAHDLGTGGPLAARAVSDLDRLATKAARGPLEPSDYMSLLNWLALLEQGLAS